VTEIATGAFTTGQKLWFDTTTGGLTATEPAINKILIAVVEKASSSPSATNGILLVRPKWVSRDIDEVDGLQTALDTVGQIAGRNTRLGFEALNVVDTSTIRSNTAVGYQALFSNTTGLINTANGTQALYSNTTGFSNTAVGGNALFSNTTGNNNTALGSNALTINTTGSNNTIIGRLSLSENTTGENNTAQGFQAGRFIANGTTANQTGSNSIFIGADTKALANGQTNQIVIGHNATGIGSNTVTLGNDSIVTTALKGNVGIGTTNPQGRLDVSGATIISGISTGITTYLQLKNATTNIALLGSEASFYSGAPSGDLGMYVYGNNKMSLSTNNVRRILIDGSGNVGINETSPTAQLQVKSSATNKVPLIVDTLASHTVNLQEWKVNGTTVSRMNLDGRFATGTGMGNSGVGGSNNAYVNVETTGTIISRNIADANDALTVNLANASSTGLILDAQAGGTTVASIAKNGTVTAPSVVATSTVKIGAWTLSQNGTSGSLDFVVV
jgi:hypothetical protein